jgi:hypothetical protein
MNKPSFKIENGQLVVDASIAIDSDKDGKVAGEASLSLKLNLAEVLNEVVKKDMPLIEAILSQIKA